MIYQVNDVLAACSYAHRMDDPNIQTILEKRSWSDHDYIFGQIMKKDMKRPEDVNNVLRIEVVHTPAEIHRINDWVLSLLV